MPFKLSFSKPGLRFVAGAVAFAALVFGAGAVCGQLGYRINPTASVPVGIWQRTPTPQPLSHGAIVSYCLPESIQAPGSANWRLGSCPDGRLPLFKPVAALAGDVVEVHPEGIAVNGVWLANSQPRPHDRNQTPLTPYPPGRYPVKARQAWLISTYHPGSYDSRYFGPVPLEALEGPIHPVLVNQPLKPYALQPTEDTTLSQSPTLPAWLLHETPEKTTITKPSESYTGKTDLLQRCGPHVHHKTLAAIMRVESGGYPWVIGVNSGTRLKRKPANQQEAIHTAKALLAANANIDLGLMQINSNNLRWLGLSVEEVFDPCTNIRAGARILTQNYQKASQSRGPGQAALEAALSAYNTGHFEHGFHNGYVGKVLANQR